MGVVEALFYMIALVIMAVVSLVLLAGAAVYSLLTGIVAFWRAAAGFLAPRPAEHLNSDESADPADFEYLAGPALRDHWRLAGTSFAAVYRRILSLSDGGSNNSLPDDKSNNLVPDGRSNNSLPDRGSNDSLLVWLLWRKHWWVTSDTPLPRLLPSAGIGVGFVVGFLAASALVAATLAVQFVVLAAIAAGVSLTSRAFWLLETGALALRGIAIACGRCHQRLIRPVFVCPCGRAHRNLMPGKQGTFHRTCRCARRLPTLLILGKHRLTARCGHCGAPLPRLAQSIPTYHLPIVGGFAAGKSVFMHTAIERLCHDPRHAVELADEHTARRFAQGREHLQGGGFVPHTPLGQPVAYTVRFGPHLLHFYDAAGEILERPRHMAVSSFVELSDGLVLIVDPFALPAVRARADATTLCEARPSVADPKAVLDVLVQTLREHRGASTALAMRVAVVITKADALLTVPNLRHPYVGLPAEVSARTAAVRDWLIDQGHRDVVNSLQNHFSEVGYFIVTYLDGASVTSRPHVDGGPAVANDDPSAPVRWLLAGGRI